MEINFYSSGYYFAETPEQDADYAIIGLPWDCTSSFKAGSRFGPQAIRQAFEAVESYSPYCRKDLTDMKIADLGDLELPFGDTQQTLDIINAQTQALLKDGKKVIAVGGEHLLTLPLVQAYHAVYGDDLHVLHIDAHCDLREDYLGVTLSHATVMQRSRQVIGPENITHFFLRSGSKEEWQRLSGSTQAHCLLYPYGNDKIEDIDLSYLKGKKLYVTLDIDVFDPSLVPGTGVVDTGGISFVDYLNLFDKLAEFDIVGFDLMELEPETGGTSVSAVMAAKVLRESILRMDK